MHSQNIDFDIDFESLRSVDIEIVIDIEKSEENIENLSGEKEASA